MDTFRSQFLAFAIERGVIRFGQFQTKAGRTSPYFFNAGLFSDGASLSTLCGFYADAVLASGITPDVIFGPAYKGIVLAAGLATALATICLSATTAKKSKTMEKGGSWLVQN
jgi:orotate phosphoribosyltransferase